jgi:hypothetical protein
MTATLFTVLIVNLRSLAIVAVAPIDPSQSVAPFRLQHELWIPISYPESKIAPSGMTVRHGTCAWKALFVPPGVPLTEDREHFAKLTIIMTRHSCAHNSLSHRMTYSGHQWHMAVMTRNRYAVIQKVL